MPGLLLHSTRISCAVPDGPFRARVESPYQTGRHRQPANLPRAQVLHHRKIGLGSSTTAISAITERSVHQLNEPVSTCSIYLLLYLPLSTHQLGIRNAGDRHDGVFGEKPRYPRGLEMR